jgi:hypothetical protein
MSKRIKAHVIKQELAKRHEEDFFITECKTGPTQMGFGLLKFDCLAIKKSRTSPIITGYKVKVDRNDFM